MSESAARAGRARGKIDILQCAGVLSQRPRERPRPFDKDPVVRKVQLPEEEVRLQGSGKMPCGVTGEQTLYPTTAGQTRHAARQAALRQAPGTLTVA